VILFGEHAAVHCRLGIATTIDKRAYAPVFSGNVKVVIESKNPGLKKFLSKNEV